MVKTVVKVEIEELGAGEDGVLNIYLSNGDTIKVNDEEHVELGKEELYAEKDYVGVFGGIYRPYSEGGKLYFDKVGEREEE